MKILQQLSGLVHNSSVTDAHRDPPRTFAAAEEEFISFLASQKYPKAICWLMRGDVVVDINRHFWIRKREKEAATYAAVRYVEGLKRNLGILLKAICATESETFATVQVPEDNLDAQGRMIGRGLKLSCPVEGTHTSIVRNPFKWRLLWWRNRQRSKDLEV